MLTCWHPIEVYRGFERVGEPRAPREHREICRGVAKRWLTKKAAVAADLGVLVMHELALTYAPPIDSSTPRSRNGSSTCMETSREI